MRRFIVFLSALPLLFSASTSARSQSTEEKIAGVENGLVAMAAPLLTDQFRTSHIKTQDTFTLKDRMAHYGVPGVGIAVISGGEIEWARGYGVVRSGGGKSVTAETCFEAASSTKLLTSVVALDFVERGLLDPDADVNQYLKTWKVPENEFTKNEKVTLRRLLTHQAGINRPDGGFDSEDGRVPTFHQVLKGEKPALNVPVTVEFVPGSAYQYSNFGYMVVQAVLEDAAGKPYQQIVEETVFGPLGMKHSTLTHPLTGRFRDNAALPHDPEGGAHDRPQHPTALAHGGLVTTPSDWALFAAELIRAHQGKSSRLLSQKSAREMFTKVVDVDPAQLFGMSQGYGALLVGGGESLYFTYPGHNAPGATCILIASPGTGNGAVIMTNGAAGLQLSLEILPALVNAYDWPTIE